jgi:hypothetical protein
LTGRGDTVIEPSISAKQNFLSLSEEFKENMDDDHINYLIEKPLHTYLREALALDPSDLVPDI